MDKKIEGDLMETDDKTPAPPKAPKAKRGRKPKPAPKPREKAVHWLVKSMQNGDLTNRLTDGEGVCGPTVVTGVRSAQAYIRKQGLAGEFVVLHAKAVLRPTVTTKTVVEFK
jgi:hypothetical protein